MDRDRIAIRISIGAVIVSILSVVAAGTSATFSYKQYALNAERDARERANVATEREPIIAIKATRQGFTRMFALQFSFQNKQYAEATVRSIQLKSPPEFTLHPVMQSTGGANVLEPYNGATMNEINEDLPTLKIGGSADWYCALVVPDTIGFSRGTVAAFAIRIEFRDNSDTEQSIVRSVTLPWN